MVGNGDLFRDVVAFGAGVVEGRVVAAGAAEAEVIMTRVVEAGTVRADIDKL